MKKRLSFLLMLLSMVASVQGTEINGLNYNLNEQSRTASVIHSDGYNQKTEIVIPASVSFDGVEYTVDRIGANAFLNNSSLKSVVIPSTVSVIDDNAFMNCVCLTSIRIPKSVTNIGSFAFNGCGCLASIVVDEENNVFDSRDNCNAIIETNTNKLRFGCNETVIPNTVTSIAAYAFYYSKIKTIVIPSSVLTIGNNAFSGCSSLESLTISKGITKLDHSLFVGCPNISSIIVDEGNTVYDSRGNCNAIIETSSNKLLLGCKNTVIPNGVTDIGLSAFEGCTDLSTITIPNSVANIEKSAFNGCRLRSVLTKNINTVINEKSFSDATFNHAMLYVPVGMWFDAVYDGGWYRFSNIREVAVETGEMSYTRAYTLMNAKTLEYAVYDAVNDEVKTGNAFYGVDESVANSCWQLVNVDGKKGLYNIGTKRYASMDSNGRIVLSSIPSSVDMKDGKDGIIIGNDTQTQWNFVVNDMMSIDKSVTGIYSLNNPSATSSTRIYDLQGRRVERVAKKGVFIKNGKKVIRR